MVLVAIITVSCSGVIYLLREQSKHRSPEAQRRRRYNTQPLVGRDLPNSQHSKKWYSYLWGSRDRHNHARLDKPMTTMGQNGQDWTQANNRELDIQTADGRALQFSGGSQSNLLRMSERGSPGSSFVGTHVYDTPQLHSPASDSTSSVRYDPHDTRNLAYPEQFVLSPQPTIPSIRSQLHSPTSSSPSSPVPRIMKSPESVTNSPPPDLGHDSVRDSLPQSLTSVLRTYGSGTKFFESF